MKRGLGQYEHCKGELKPLCGRKVRLDKYGWIGGHPPPLKKYVYEEPVDEAAAIKAVADPSTIAGELKPKSFHVYGGPYGYEGKETRAIIGAKSKADALKVLRMLRPVSAKKFKENWRESSRADELLVATEPGIWVDASPKPWPKGPRTWKRII